MQIPTVKVKNLSQAERFCEGLKMLSEECNVSSITYNRAGFVMFHFNDGSSVAGIRACIEAGLLDYNNFA